MSASEAVAAARRRGRGRPQKKKRGSAQRRAPAGTAGWNELHVRRLFWRAGFGATPAEAKRWAARGKEATLDFVMNGAPGGVRLRGPEPRVDGAKLDPNNEFGHDVLWWLDRMVRTSHPLQEKLTLFWHDHFASSDQGQAMMLAQNRMLRRRAFGSFRALLGDVTRDPAMQLFLSLADSTKEAPNENYARELMELFTLGRGYTERDVREAARALTGFVADYRDDGTVGIRFDASQHDAGRKQLLGRKGAFKPDDVLDIVVRHPLHAPFMVTKLWEFFHASPPSRATVRGLAALYRRERLQIKPVVRAILEHPLLYRRLEAPDMVKSPVVYVAGALRTTGSHVNNASPVFLLEAMGQLPFDPPSVAGWEWGPAWMSSNAMRQRFSFGNSVIEDGKPSVREGGQSPRLKPAEAFERAWKAVGEPQVSAHTRSVLTQLAANFSGDLDGNERADALQYTLRHLLIVCPDSQLC